MKYTVTRLFLVVIALFSMQHEARAQQFSGFATVQLYPGRIVFGPLRACGPPCILAYADTEEDYTASLYYNVQNTNAIFSGGSNTVLASAAFSGNPSAAGEYWYSGTPIRQIGQPATPFAQALYTAVTEHIVDFFYISALGEYYDPYGFSVMNGDGGYDSDYWFSLDVYGLYIAEAAAVLGESYNSTNASNGDYQGPAMESILYQAFIPPDWVTGPPAVSCPNNIFAGDNRGFNPLLGSYRVMQGIAVGIGGLTTINLPAQATGWTFQFSQNVLQNNVIPATAYNFNYLGQCSSNGVNAYGHASTAGMTPPLANDTGISSTTTFSGSSGNPVPLISFPINWNATVTLSEPSVADLNVAGVFTGTCYPAHEISVGETDVMEWMPPANNIGYITACLAGFNPVTELISSNIALAPFPPPLSRRPTPQ
jgi:hypothetical protein